MGKQECPLTEEQVETLHHAARQTWDYIGYDALRALAEYKGKDGVSIPRAHVIELVVDADRMNQFLKDPELREVVKKIPYDDLVEILKPAFPYTRYGM